jgi:hypothetical protein
VFEFDDDDRLRAAALALYEAGVWSSPNVPVDRAAAMWGQLRDALGLEQGHATERGVGAESREAEASSRGDVTFEPDPGDGYRWVKCGETLVEGDELWVFPGEWRKISWAGDLCTCFYEYRRRIDDAPEPSSGACQLPAETTPRGGEVRREVRSKPDPAVAMTGPGSTQADRWLPGEIGAESPDKCVSVADFLRPVLHSIAWDGYDTPDPECCFRSRNGAVAHLALSNSTGTVVPLYVVPMSAAREIDAGRWAAEEAKQECERLRMTQEEREAIEIAERRERGEWYGNPDYSRAISLRNLRERHANGGAA